MSEPFVFTSQAHLVWTDSTGDKNQFTFDNVLSEEWKNSVTITEHPVEQGANVSDHIRVELPEVTLTVHCTNEPVDSNAFQDPVLAPLAIDVATPSWPTPDGVVVTSRWENLIGLRAQAEAAAGGARARAALTAVAGQLSNVLGTDLGVFDGIEVDYPVLTDAGLVAPAPSGTINASTLQFPNGYDFVEETVATLLGLKDAGQLFTVRGTKQQADSMALQSVSHSRSSEDGTGLTLTLSLKQILIVSTQTVTAPIPALPRAVPAANKGAQNPSDAPPQQQQSVARALATALASFFSKGGGISAPSGS